MMIVTSIHHWGFFYPWPVAKMSAQVTCNVHSGSLPQILGWCMVFAGPLAPLLQSTVFENHPKKSQLNFHKIRASFFERTLPWAHAYLSTLFWAHASLSALFFQKMELPSLAILRKMRLFTMLFKHCEYQRKIDWKFILKENFYRSTTMDGWSLTLWWEKSHFCTIFFSNKSRRAAEQKENRHKTALVPFFAFREWPYLWSKIHGFSEKPWKTEIRLATIEKFGIGL